MKVSRILGLVILAIVVVPSVIIGSYIVRAKLYDHRLAQIAMGQPKQNVIAAMGNPSAIEKCHGPVHYDGKLTGECSEEYIYYLILGKWVVSFDKDGHVIGRYNHVSP